MLSLSDTDAFSLELLQMGLMLELQGGADYPLFICKGSNADVGLGETVLFSGNMLSKLLKCHCEMNVH